MPKVCVNLAVVLGEDMEFDGKREYYLDFVKLMGKRMEGIRVKKQLKVATKWEVADTVP